MRNVSSSIPLDQMIGKRVTLSGDAMDSKAGAVVRLRDETVVYVRGLDYWEDSLVGGSVEVEGTLRSECLTSGPLVDETGAFSQGSDEEQFFLDSAVWRRQP